MNQPLQIPETLAETPAFKPELLIPPVIPQVSGRSTGKSKPQLWDPEQALFRLSKDVVFTSRNACEGIMVLGQTGAGKSSAMKTAYLNYLKAGMGFLVLCVKPEEGSDWERYAATTGRSQDVIRITADADCKYRFDFFKYEMAQVGSSTQATVAMLQEITAVMRRGNGGGGSNEEFWVANSNTLLKNTIDLYKLATIDGKTLVEQGCLPADTWLPPYKSPILTIMELITSAAVRSSDFLDPRTIESSLNLKCLDLAAKVSQWYEANPSNISKEKVQVYNLTASFWHDQWAKGDGGDTKLKDSIIAFARSTLDILERGEVANLFRQVYQFNPETQREEWMDTVTPDMLDQGKIIIVDVPVLTWSKAGQLAGCIWKYVVQRWLERRADRTDKDVDAVNRRHQLAKYQADRALCACPAPNWFERTFGDELLRFPGAAKLFPYSAATWASAKVEAQYLWDLKLAQDGVRYVAIIIDECQHFITKRDVEYQATARSQRACVIMLTQTIAALGDSVGKETWESLISNLTNKVFCNNGHAATNKYASDILGSRDVKVKTEGQNRANVVSLKLPGVNVSYTKQHKPWVEPSCFMKLKTGGAANNYIVEAYFVIGAKAGNRPHFLKVQFNQRIGQKANKFSQKMLKRAKAELEQ